MKSSDHGYFAALTYDLRVRERLIAAGVVTQADIDRYLGEIPELETHAENLGIAQPALGGSGAIAAAPAPAPAPAMSAPVAAVSAPAPSSVSSADGEASEDDDDDEDGEP